MNTMKLIVALVIAAVLVVFGAQNTQLVTFHFLTFELGPAPVILAVFAAAIAGALLAWIVSAPGRFRGMRRRRDLEHQVAAANERDAQGARAISAPPATPETIVRPATERPAPPSRPRPPVAPPSR